MSKIYFVGGSPCAGKSTICEIISKKYDLYYYKVDDYLDGYMKLAAKNNKPLCKKKYSNECRTNMDERTFDTITRRIWYLRRNF